MCYISRAPNATAIATFNWAILGLGKIARKFAEDLQRIDDARLVAVGSRSLERARAFAADFGAEHAAGSYAATFDGPRVDAVYVATPHTGHRELTLLCLERGIPVLCEKPMGLNYAEVEEMVNAARRTNTYLMEALWSCFIPALVEVKRTVEAGAIGTLEGLRADFGFRGVAREDFDRDRLYNPALGGGALLDIGIYPIWLAQYLFGAPEEIHGVARLTELGADVDTQVTLRYPGGRLAHCYSTLLGATKTDALLLGSEGELHLHSRFHHAHGFSLLKGDEVPPTNHYHRFEGHGYQYEARAVMDDLRAGRKESPIWSLDDSLLLHRTLTEVRRQIGVVYPGE
ncbi:Gfo/Idh/MocA family protein [Neolewinella litorea]|uniref:Gfo/Idh/MocA family oxidoreductase n=1 Tax=Neolewinella litorea TaxID=2562452 RepID=A0A4S4NUA2_9BACT|nr:Gfo/Idh/MocA family oxidoreductase [Neolewinella litorea]THH39820.1 Gfo/Idh/MocA family oxidoreductase [Neolewinella litorea]